VLQQALKGEFLCRSPSIFRSFPIFRHTTDVTDPNRINVVSGTMRSNLSFWSAVMDFTVAVDNVVIPDSDELPLLMPTSDVSDGEVFPFRRSGAVNNDFSNLSHAFFTSFPSSLSWIPNRSRMELNLSFT
jgi:hypothetical protein